MLLTPLLVVALAQPAHPAQPAGQNASTPTPPQAAALPAPQSAAHWKGSIELPGGRSLTFILTVTAPDAATIAIPDQNLPDTPLTDVSVSSGAMKFKLTIPGAPPGANPVFDLTIDPAGEARGTMQQSGLTLTAVAKPLAAGESAAPSRPQTPVPPFPYSTREVSYSSFDGAAINGTLTLPAPTGNTGAKPPCVLFITGSGLQDRDETLFSHKPFAVIADALARAGIASLRVDDRAWNGAKNPAGDDVSTETFALDTACGVDFLTGRPDIDPARIGLIGHSEGGLIAPAVAARKPESVSFIVLLAGPGVTGREVLERQLVAILRSQGAPEERIAAAAERQKRLLAAVTAGDDAAVRRAVREGLQENDPTGSMKGPALEQAVEIAMKRTSSPWMRHFLTRDPREDLRKVRCPVLVLNGSKDAQVVAEQNVPEVVKALLAGGGGNTAVTARVFPNLNHLFQPVGDNGTGGVDEYGRIETTTDPEALVCITQWVKQTTKP
ncbi:MAG: alpha/beta hydrolase [Phycisphaerales bacterium]|nr:alpha/beta hydrolase [Phycisphaerales bacterium]